MNKTIKEKLEKILLSTITEKVGEEGIHAVSKINTGGKNKRKVVFFFLNLLTKKGTTWEDPEADF